MPTPTLPAALSAARTLVRDAGLDAWLVHDFRNRNPVLAQLMGGPKSTSRRVDLFLYPERDPVLLVHTLDAEYFAGSGVERSVYLGWPSYAERLAGLLKGRRRVAMEYVPRCDLPNVSAVDAGTIEVVRELGAEVVSSADLVQRTVARWSATGRRLHDRASDITTRAKDEAFALIARELSAGRRVTELDVQRHVSSVLHAHGLEFDHPCIVAVNEHSGDPHFSVSPSAAAEIRKGDWVLLDLWGKDPHPEAVYSDITWTAFAGSTVPEPIREVYDAVNAARDACLAFVQDAWKAGRAVRGFEADDAARGVLVARGFEGGIRHRTGHSLSAGPTAHGLGVNIDNLETHDTRQILPGLGFTIEPGLYFPKFGVRSEINVYVDETQGPIVTSAHQAEPVLLA